MRGIRAILVMGGVCLATILAALFTQTQLYLNQTPSLPYKVFFCINRLKPQKGDFVSIYNHPTAYFGNIPYTKRLVGLPGDSIHLHHAFVSVGFKPIGPLLENTRDGKPLHPLKKKTIPYGYVFVSADHSRSFDSRYEEFGLVKRECLIGKCFGFFKVNTFKVNTRVQGTAL